MEEQPGKRSVVVRAVGNPGRACRGVAVCACRFVWMEDNR